MFPPAVAPHLKSKSIDERACSFDEGPELGSDINDVVVLSFEKYAIAHKTIRIVTSHVNGDVFLFCGEPQ